MKIRNRLQWYKNKSKSQSQACRISPITAADLYNNTLYTNYFEAQR